MRAEGHTVRRFLPSNCLTIAIVGTVVLVNSVAWGIPLLVRDEDRPAMDQMAGIGAVARSALQHSSLVTAAIPLPVPAPPHSDIARTGLAPVSRPPATLFPRPEPAPRFATQSVAAGRIRPAERSPQGRQEIVSASPYSPGVRPGADGGLEWRHRILHDPSGASTLEAAKAIARRAAERIDQMRDRMAKLDAPLSEDENARQRTLLPVAPQPPRIVGNFGVAKNEQSSVRPRLVRRPIGTRVATSAPAPQVASAAVRPASELRFSRQLAARQRAVAATEPQRPARLSPPSESAVSAADAARAARAASAARAARTAEVARADEVARIEAAATARRRLAALNAAAPRRTLEQHVRVRPARATRYRRKQRNEVRMARQRPRIPNENIGNRGRIDGFRRGFHRQLVRSNFFGSTN